MIGNKSKFNHMFKSAHCYNLVVAPFQIFKKLWTIKILCWMQHNKICNQGWNGKMSLKMLVRFEGWTFILRIFSWKPFKCCYVAIAMFTTCKTLHMLPFLLILLQAFNTKNECLKGKISSYYYIPTLKFHIHTNGELWYLAFTFVDVGNKSWGSEVTIKTPCRSLF
jgi:hypothetical protein